jgi:hypothetical protein
MVMLANLINCYKRIACDVLFTVFLFYFGRFVFDNSLERVIVYESMDSPWCVEENKKALQEMNTSFY